MNNSIKSYFPFAEFRKHQEKCIQNMIDTYESGKKFFILEAPTGFGKSATAFTSARIILDKIKQVKKDPLCSPPIVVCTKTRMLQNQYINSFSNYNIRKLWSSSHYPCELQLTDNDFHYGSSLCPGKETCYKASSCKYLLAKNKFFGSEIGVLNYHYFLHSREVLPSVLILDEAHNIENILCGIMEVKISLYSIQKLCEILEMMQLQYNRTALVNSCKNVVYSKELDKLSLEQFYEQLSDAKRLIASKKQEVLSTDNINKYLIMAKAFAKGIKIADNILNKLDKYFKSEAEWIVSENRESSVTIKPLDINECTGVFNRPKFVIFMSATICDPKQFCKGLNIEKNNCDFESIPSEIPTENRKVYEVNVGSMNSKNKKDLFPLFVEVTDSILDQAKNERGIIHSVSYSNAKEILKLSKHRKRMVILEKLLSVEEILLGSKDTILVSPSIMEGVDLKDDISRFQIFFKIPYAYLGDKWVKTKMDRDYKWYMRDAAIKLVQGSGRSIRSDEDYAVTFILDSNFNRIKFLLPEWYLDAVEEL